MSSVAILLIFLSSCVSPTGEPNGAVSSAKKVIHSDSAKPISGSPLNGKTVFWAGGCASCHSAANSRGEARLLLGGGLELKSKFGMFRAPNISPDKSNGIGNWSQTDFENAMLKGVAPNGRHYFPAFPYTSYARMTKKDIRDLWAFLQTLPRVENKVADHDVSSFFKTRTALGLWKKLYFKPGKVVSFSRPTAEIVRGQYLVEGPGHCSECHTPRNSFGGYDYSRWLAGGEMDGGDVTVPNLTPHKTGMGDKSLEEIETLLLPSSSDVGYVVSGMEEVRQNLANLAKSDRTAIAAYLKAIPAVPIQN